MQLFEVVSPATLASSALVLLAACANGGCSGGAPEPAAPRFSASAASPSAMPAPTSEASAPAPGARAPRCEARRDCIGAPSRCERRRDCSNLRDGFAGLTIENLCGPLMPPPEVAAPYTSEMPLRARYEFPDSGFQCVVTQMKGELCQVVCDANAPRNAADPLLSWIVDRYGRYNERSDDGGMRTWSWSEPTDYFEVERLGPWGVDPARPFLRVTSSFRRGGPFLRLEYAIYFQRATLRPLER